MILTCAKVMILFPIGFGERTVFMAKQRRTLDERIQSCTTKEEEMLEKLKQYQAQRKQLEKQKKAERISDTAKDTAGADNTLSLPS